MKTTIQDHNEPTAATVLTVTLTDETGTSHDVLINEDDWATAIALTDQWHIETEYEKLQVVSSALAAVRNIRDSTLSLATYIMKPGYRESARFLNGNTLDLRRDNLVVRGKWQPTIARPPREPTLKELRSDAMVCAIVDKLDPQAEMARVTAEYYARKKAERAEAAGPKAPETNQATTTTRNRTRRPAVKAQKATTKTVEGSR